MAQSNTRNGGIFGSKCVNASPEPVPSFINTSSDERVPKGAAAELVLGAPDGSVLALGGIDGESLRMLLDQVEPAPNRRRAFFVRVEPAPSADSIVEQVVDLLAHAAHRLWPFWFTNVSFAECRSDALGRFAAGVIARKAAEEIAGLSPSWAEAATRLALEDRRPRVSGAFAALELAQLALTICRSGLVLLADVTEAAQTGPNPAALVRALEWIAQHSHGAVVALFEQLPPNVPPFDRILYGARRVMTETGREQIAMEFDAIETTEAEPWIAPWRGLPHPLGESNSDLPRRSPATPSWHRYSALTNLWKPSAARGRRSTSCGTTDGSLSSSTAISTTLRLENS